MRPPRFLMLHREDIRDRRTWSGIPFKMYEALRARGAEVVLCDRLGYPRSARLAIENRLLRWGGYTTFYRRRTAEHYADLVSERLRPLAGSWDVLLAVDSIVEVALLDIDKPLVIVSDATNTLLMETSYPGYDSFSARAQRSISDLERTAYQRAALVVFSSSWAAAAAVQHHAIPAERIEVVPFGANIDHVPPRQAACQAGPWRHPEVCELLFLGVDWERKRGWLALETLRELNRTGLRSRLTVCGNAPALRADADLEVVPFLDKNRPAELARLEGLLARSSYLLLPSRSECSPIVFCEASAYGLPAVSCDVGGISQIIEHGRTGFLLPRDAPPAAFAAQIAASFRDQEGYRRMRVESRDRYDSLLNWDHWAGRLIQLAGRLGSGAELRPSATDGSASRGV